MTESPPPAIRHCPPMWVMILIAAVILVVGGFLVYSLLPLDASIPEGVETHYVGIERGYTEQGFPQLGDPDAPVLVEAFSSYACPHCRTFHEEQFEDMLDALAAGEVQFVMIPIPHIGSGASTAAKGALCGGEQGQFWEMHDTLYYWQSRSLGSLFPERRVKQGAENLGLDTAAFDACMNSERVQSIMDEARQEFDRRQLRGTPSLFINGQRVLDYDEFEHLGEPESNSG